MRRNILLLKRNKQNQKEDLKKLQESVAQKAEFKRLNDPDPNKYNPDIPSKYQNDKNTRNKIIKPSNFKIDNNKIIEKKENLNTLLKETIKDRENKIDIPLKVVKKRIINTNKINEYTTQKSTVNELKKKHEKYLEEGNKVKNSILDFYN